MSKLTNIQEALRNYNPNQSKSQAEVYFEPNNNMITWEINHLCNFRCPYCGNFTKDHPDTYKYSPEHIYDQFKKTGKTWHIIITGGEPFLHKHIIKICELLSKDHYLSINSNLSTDNISEFAEKINPDRVITINASIHILSRDTDAKMEKYLDNYRLLKEKGFNVIGSYVVYPPLLQRFENDIEWLKSKGVDQISSKIFHGEYKGKVYPAAFSDEAMTLQEKYMFGEIEMPEYLVYKHFKGLKCSTGRKMLSMLPNGDIQRCLSDHTFMGNFFDNSFQFPKKDKKCKVDECTCPYQGMLFTKNRRFFKKDVTRP